MAKYNTTETLVIKRSKIKFAPYNPKKHNAQHIEKVRANIERVAFFGGVVWNKTSGNLVDGHKRIMSLDILHGYTGKAAQDYDVKVEACELDSIAEREQNVFFDKSRTQIDNAMLADMLHDINPQNAGISDYGLPIDTAGGLKIDTGFGAGVPQDAPVQKDNTKSTPTPPMDASAGDAQGAPKQKSTALCYLSVTFETQAQKNEFMDLLNADRFLCVLQGEDLSNLIAGLKK